MPNDFGIYCNPDRLECTQRFGVHTRRSWIHDSKKKMTICNCSQLRKDPHDCFSEEDDFSLHLTTSGYVRMVVFALPSPLQPRSPAQKIHDNCTLQWCAAEVIDLDPQQYDKIHLGRKDLEIQRGIHQDSSNKELAFLSNTKVDGTSRDMMRLTPEESFRRLVSQQVIPWYKFWPAVCLTHPTPS